MKPTLVVGVFDAALDAGQVLRQLAASPLDLHDVVVLHRDGELQSQLRREAGVPPDRAPLAAAVLGALLGAAIGVIATEYLPALGLALNAAVGGVLGAVATTVGSIAMSPLRIPPEHREELARAVEAGASIVIVRADGLPTASAIGDLFLASGARSLDLGSAETLSAVASGAPEPDLVGAATRGPSSAVPDSADAATDSMFLPPHRRSSQDGESEKGV
jgi:uncharacterized membrane protein